MDVAIVDVNGNVIDHGVVDSVSSGYIDIRNADCEVQTYTRIDICPVDRVEEFTSLRRQHQADLRKLRAEYAEKENALVDSFEFHE